MDEIKKTEISKRDKKNTYIVETYSAGNRTILELLKKIISQKAKEY